MNYTVLRRCLLLSAASIMLSMTSTMARAEPVLRIAMTSDDVPRTNGMPSQGFEGLRFLGYPAFEPLVNWDLSSADKAATLTPGLATSWEIDPTNNKRWIFKLRQGVTFHDGSDFNADAVTFNLGRFYDKDAPQFDAVAAGLTQARNPLVASWNKIDDYTVAISTTEPASYFPYLMTLVLVSSPTGWEAAGKDWNEFGKHPAGTGPFEITGFVPRRQASLKPYHNYWNKDRIPKVELLLLPMPESTTRLAALESGEVDWIEAPPPDAIPSLKSGGFEIYSNVYPHLWGWLLSTVDGSPFKDKRVRLAANYCVDRDGIVSLLNGMAAPALGFVTPGSPMFGSPTEHYSYDPEKAKALLAEAGYDQSKPIHATVVITTGGSGQMIPLPMNEYIQQTLKECGFDIQFKAVDVGTALITLRSAPNSPQTFGAQALQWATGSSDPSWLFRHFHSKSFSPTSYNWGHWNSPEFDSIMDEASLTFDEAKATKLLARAHELVVDDAPWLFVVHDVAPRAMTSKVKGYVQSQSWFQDLTQITLE